MNAATIDVRNTMAPCAQATGRCATENGREHECPDAVRQQGGRWFITMGHAGFNTRPNNGRGYKTERHARVIVEQFSPLQEPTFPDGVPVTIVCIENAHDLANFLGDDN